MRKVLFFIPQFPVLTETFIERETSKLVELGNLNIKVFSLKLGEGSLSENLKDKVIYYKLNILDCVLGSLKFVIFKPQNWHLIKYIFSDTNLILNKTIFLKSVGYAEAISKLKVDHIHAHYLSDSSSICFFVCKMLNLPLSISAHANDIFVASSLVKPKIQYSKFISICNKNAYQYLKDSNPNLNTENLHLLYHGLDKDKVFGDRVRHKTFDDKLRLITIARFTEKKGLNYLIDAALLLKNQNFKFELNIVGKGAEYQKLKNQISELDLQNYVFIPNDNNGVQNSEVVNMLLSSDIFVFPNIKATDNDVDGIANGLVEASYAKVPIITTEAGSNLELVNNESAFIIPQRDAQAICSAIMNIYNNQELALSKAEKAYENALKIMDLTKNAKKLESLFLTANI